MSADITPGTLCMIVDGIDPALPAYRGRFVTVLRRDGSYDDGQQRYIADATWTPRRFALARSHLRPILPPDTAAPIADDVLEEAA